MSVTIECDTCGQRFEGDTHCNSCLENLKTQTFTLQNEVDELESENKALEEQITDLETRLKNIEK